MKLPLRYYGDPILRKKGELVGEITDEIRKLALDMIETMDANNGIGLAAPQIGESLRLFVLRRYLDTEGEKLQTSDPFVYINPKITYHSEEVCTETEGCLSIPGIRLPVTRPWKIVVEALDLEGREVVHELEGMNARVVMHENDHINGTLFIDRVEKGERKKIEGELKAIKLKALDEIESRPLFP